MDGEGMTVWMEGRDEQAKLGTDTLTNGNNGWELRDLSTFVLRRKGCEAELMSQV